MYNKNFVLALKVNGKVLRETGDTVTLPFGAEFSFVVKNLNSVRAQFSVCIDGQQVTDGCRVILPAGGSVELERFIKGGNLNQGNRFKFIERSEAIEQHRGVGVEDGLVRVECWKEQVYTPPSYYDRWHPNKPPYYPTLYNTTLGDGCYVGASSSLNSQSFRSFDSTGEQPRSSSCNFVRQTTNSAKSVAANDAGITVPGSLSSQRFHSGYGFPLETQSSVMTLKLSGENYRGIPVTYPVTVSTNIICAACGKSNNSADQYCSRCGSAVHVL